MAKVVSESGVAKTDIIHYTLSDESTICLSDVTTTEGAAPVTNNPGDLGYGAGQDYYDYIARKPRMGKRSAAHFLRMLRQELMGYAALTHPTLATLAFFIFINQAPAKASTLQPSNWDYAHCSLSSKEQKDMPAINRLQVQVLGKGLREDLNNIYNKLSNDATNPIPENSIEVNAIFLKYIKTGMKFSDAESILSVAGFSLDAKPSFVFYRNGGKDEKLFLEGAQIEPFSQHFLGRTNLIVLLFPQKNSDFSRVCNLSASFLEATL
jgi:hypothetical protein